MPSYAESRWIVVGAGPQKDLEKHMTAQMKADKRQIMELEEENAIPKSSAHLHASTEMKYGFIHANSTEFRVTMICEVLKMSGSGYYAWGKRGPSLRSAKDEILVDGFERSTR